jgi:hypothetical protein
LVLDTGSRAVSSTCPAPPKISPPPPITFVPVGHTTDLALVDEESLTDVAVTRTRPGTARAGVATALDAASRAVTAILTTVARAVRLIFIGSSRVASTAEAASTTARGWIAL